MGVGWGKGGVGLREWWAGLQFQAGNTVYRFKAPAGWEELVPWPCNVLCSVEKGLRKRRTACAPQNTTAESIFKKFAGIL